MDTDIVATMEAMMVTVPLVAGTVEVTMANINRERRRDGAFFVFSQVLRNLSYNKGKGLMEVWICNS